jgi:RimJ/RimL family protein N-acetyltransferase
MKTTVRVRLEPWSADDLDLLRRANTPEMTAHLGGPETEQKLLERHRRYLDIGDTGRVFRVVLASDAAVTGSVVFWEREWRGRPVWEMGWVVLPGFQGRGIATAAAVAAIDAARAEHRHRYVHAFPAVDHPASNGVCRRAGFELLGGVDFEYPVGRPMRCHNWRLDLEAA